MRADHIYANHMSSERGHGCQVESRCEDAPTPGRDLPHGIAWPHPRPCWLDHAMNGADHTTPERGHVMQSRILISNTYFG